MFPDSVTTIEEFAFSYSQDLTIVSIGESAFQHVTASSFYLTDTLEFLGNQAFVACIYLKNIDNTPSYASLWF